jgi:hypothetical protein
MGCVACFLLLSLAFLPLHASAAIVWSDNFDDGNYDGWTVIQQTYDVVDGVLVSTQDIRQCALIHHDSVIDYGNGTWTIDIVNPGLGLWVGLLTDTPGSSGMNYHLSVFDQSIELTKRTPEGGWPPDTLASWISPKPLDDSTTNFIVTLTDDNSGFWRFDIFVNGTHRISQEVFEVDFDWAYFNIRAYDDGIGFDNITVSNTIDFVCTNETCELCQREPTATPTPAPTSTPTPTPTPTTAPNDQPPNMTLPIIGAGAVAVVVIVAIIVKKR